LYPLEVISVSSVVSLGTVPTLAPSGIPRLLQANPITVGEGRLPATTAAAIAAAQEQQPDPPGQYRPAELYVHRRVNDVAAETVQEAQDVVFGYVIKLLILSFCYAFVMIFAL